MNFRTQKSLTTIQENGIFGGIQTNRSIVVLNQHKTGKPEEIYWARQDNYKLRIILEQLKQTRAVFFLEERRCTKKHTLEVEKTLFL